MIHNLKSQNDFSGFYIIYSGSILNEKPKSFGLSHMCEHLMCKQFEVLYDDFDRFGINWNAFTSNNNIVFHMTGLDEYINKYKGKMLNYLLKFNVTENQFNIEKNIIIQEYIDHFQDQSDAHYTNVMRYYLGHYGPIGKKESLDNLSYNHMIKFYNNYMKKPSMIINVSKYNEFSGYTDFAKYNNDNFLPIDTKITIEKKANFDKSSIIGYKLITKDFPYIKFIIAMLNGSLKAPFYEELREKRGLTYGVSTFINAISKNQGILSTSLVTDNDKVDEVLDVYKEILTNPDIYMTEKRFNIMKDYYAILFKKNEINRYSKVGHLMSPYKWNIESILDNITYPDIMTMYEKHFKYNDFRWSVDKKDFV